MISKEQIAVIGHWFIDKALIPILLCLCVFIFIIIPLRSAIWKTTVYKGQYWVTKVPIRENPFLNPNYYHTNYVVETKAGWVKAENDNEVIYMTKEEFRSKYRRIK